MRSVADTPSTSASLLGGIPRRWYFWSAFAASSVGTGLALPFLGYYLHVVRHHSSLAAGMLLGLLALANFSCALSSGRLIDRFGSRRVLLAGTVLQLVGYLGLSVSNSPPVVIWLVVIGAGNGIFNAGLPGVMRSLGTEAERPHLFSVNYVIINLGMGVGALIGSVLTRSHTAASYELVFLINALSYACLTVAVALVVRPGIQAFTQGAGRGGVLAVLRDRRLALLVLTACLAMVVGFAQLETAAPLLLQGTLSASSWTVGAFVALNTGVIVIAQLPITRLAARVPPQTLPLVMAGVWGLAALSAVGLSVLGQPVAGALAFAVLFGIGECLFSPSLPVILLAISPAERQGRYNALYSAGFTGSGTVGSVVAVLGVGYLSFTAYWVAMLAAAALLLYVAVLLRRAVNAGIPVAAVPA
jgi:MFS family permease